MLSAASVCLSTASERVNIGWWNLVGRCNVQKSWLRLNLGSLPPLSVHLQKCGVGLRRWENQRRLCSGLLSAWHRWHLHCEPIKNTPKCFCHIFHKTQSILIKFGTQFLNKFAIQQFKRFLAHLDNVTTIPCETWRSRFVSEQQLELRTPKHTKCFSSHRLQNQADSDKMLYFLS